MVEVKSCGAIVFHEDGIREYLLVYKKDRKYWGFPKGTPEGSETEEQTTLREIREEVGLDVELVSGFKQKIGYYAGKDVRSTMTLFLARSRSKDARCEADEISDFKWLTFTDALDTVSHKTNRKALEDAENFLRK